MATPCVSCFAPSFRTLRATGGSYGSNLSNGLPDGWLPLRFLSRIDFEPWGQLFDVRHDGRYSLDDGTTIYSNFAVGTRWGGADRDKIGLQFGHQRGRNLLSVPVFEAASVGAFYRWSPKWEFEYAQSISLLEDSALGFGLIVRRYGHDVLFELQIDNRVGEGFSVGFGIKPSLGYRPSRIGYLSW